MWAVAGGLVLILLIVIVALIIYARWNYGTLEKLGFPTVPPKFVFGTISPIGFRPSPEIWAYLWGRQPKVFVSDPDLVKQILVKDYDYFSDRLTWELLHHEIPLGFLDFQLGDNWRILRASLTKGLSLTRVKTMAQVSNPLIHEYVTGLVQDIKKRTTIDFRKSTASLSILLSCHLFLSVQPKDCSSTFVSRIGSFFVDGITSAPSFTQTLGYTFPFLGKYTSPGPFSIPFFRDETLDQFVKIIAQVLEYQRDNERGKDMITLLLDLMDQTASPRFQALGITKTTIMSQIFGLFWAMQEGVPTAIAPFFYNMARSPQALTKLLAEVDELSSNADGSPSLDNISRLPYLTACLMESFRILPTFHRLDRLCVQNWTEPTRGIRIPKGVPVYICLWPMHYNPRHFPQPTQFRPERFLPEHKSQAHPYAFGIFGHGPKNCPGSRLIMDLLKICIFIILKHFTVVPCSDYVMKQYPGFGPFLRTNPILVDLIPRSHIVSNANAQ